MLHLMALLHTTGMRMLVLLLRPKLLLAIIGPGLSSEDSPSVSLELAGDIHSVLTLQKRSPASYHQQLLRRCKA